MEPHGHLEYLGYLIELGATSFLVNKLVSKLADVTGSTTLDTLVNTTPKAVATSAVIAYPLVNLVEYFLR